MIADRLNPRNQLVIDHSGRAVFQLAHLLVEERDQVFDAIGHRRIRGEAGIAGIALLGDGAIGVGAVLQIGGLRLRNRFRQYFHFFVDPRPAAEESVNDLLEVEQPEGQPQISRRQHQRLVAEAAAIFVVWIDQKDAQVRPGLENFLKDDGDTARFSDAGGADDGEMSADELLDVDLHAHVRILLQMSDVDAVAIVGAVNHAQFRFRQQNRGVANVGILQDAALELRRRSLRADCADEIDLGDAAKCLPADRGQNFLANFGDQSDDDAFRRHHTEKFSDGCAAAALRADCKLDGRFGSCDPRHPADGLWPGRRALVAYRCCIHDTK